MIEIKNLMVSIEGKRVLENANLHIAHGENVVLFCPNGSGKTSLLKSICLTLAIQQRNKEKYPSVIMNVVSTNKN